MRKLLLIALFLPFAALSAAKLLPDEQNNVDIYKRCNPAVVNITTVTLKRDFFLDIVPQQGLGSGAFIRADGYVLTNEHVLGNAQQVQVTTFDKTVYPAKVIGVDPDSDLAVLKIEAPGKKHAFLDFQTSELQVGQKVFAIGNPFGFGGSLSVGIISAVGRDIRATTQRLIKNVIQTDAAINPGNSGGPLLDSEGKMIGVNAQIFTQSGGSEGIGFAISMETVRKVTSQLIEYGMVARPELGMNGIGFSPELLSQLGVPLRAGVMVTEIVRGGPAAKAGLKPHQKELVWRFQRIPVGGDVIFQVDDQAVGTYGDLLDYVFQKKAGDTITIHFWRNGKKQTAAIKLELPARFRAKSL